MVFVVKIYRLKFVENQNDMSYQENQISDQIDAGLEAERQEWERLDRIHVWVQSFCVIYSKKKEFEGRLKELETWDKPRKGQEYEHETKVLALKHIIGKI